MDMGRASPDPDRIVRDLNWNLLRTFVALAESGSVTEAAERLHLKQPTVSIALKNLEELFGRKLIERTRGQYALTEAGELLYREANDINGSILRLSTLMREVTPEIRGQVNISVASHVVCPLFDSVLAGFFQQNPLASLSIDVMASADAIAEVAAKRASFALALVREKNPRLQYRVAYREFFGLFCGPRHPLFGRQDLELADLRGHSSVIFDNDRMQDALQDVTVMRARAALGPKVSGISANLEEVRRMVVAGLGIGPLPTHVVAQDVENGLLWQVPPFEDLPAIDVHLVWNPEAAKNRAEERLLSQLIEAVERTPFEARKYV